MVPLSMRARVRPYPLTGLRHHSRPFFVTAAASSSAARTAQPPRAVELTQPLNAFQRDGLYTATIGHDIFAAKATNSNTNTEPEDHVEPEAEVQVISFPAFDPGATRGIVLPLPPPEADEPADEPVETVKLGFSYFLPYALRPVEGTTFYAKACVEVEATATTTTMTVTTQTGKRIGFLQALLYGIPDPESFRYRECFAKQGGFLHCVLFGVKEAETVVVKVEKEDEGIAIKVEVEVEITTEVEIEEEHGGQMVAK